MILRFTFWSVLAALVACAHQPTEKAPELPIDVAQFDQSAIDHNHEVLVCYQETLLKTPNLEGQLVLNLDVARDTHVREVHVVHGVSKEFDECVIAKVQKWTYPWVRKQIDDITDPFHVYRTPEGQPMSEFSGPQWGQKDEIYKAVRENLPEVRKCYDARTHGVKRAEGGEKLVLEWDIDVDGAVQSAKVKQGLEGPVDTCVLDKVKSMKFPAPANRMVNRVTYPFIFSVQ